MVFERKGSDCAHCPFQERRRVWGTGPADPLFCIVGEAPGKEEDAQGKPFVGPAGAMLHELLAAAGVTRSSVWITNRICCRPPNNQIDTIEARTAIDCCRAGFDEERRWLREHGCVTYVPVGNTALLALDIPPKITEYRGYVHELPGKAIAIPTFHPSFLIRGQLHEKPTVICDLAKAARLAESGWKRPLEQFITHPTLVQLEKFAGSVTAKTMVGVDIETTALRPEKGQIVVIGLASSPQKAISVPFLKHGGGPYWKEHELPLVKKLVQRIFSVGKLIFQNALFDVRWLIHNGWNIPDPIDDLLLLHHAIHPELPHSLRYIASVYTDVPHWKGVLRDRVGRITDMEDDELRTYNLRDATVLLRAYPSLLDDAKELGVLPVYETISKPLVRPILDMVDTGLPLDRKALGQLRVELAATCEGLAEKLRSCCGLPPQWNPATPDHVRLLVYPSKPKQFERAAEELAKLHANPRSRRDTKKYREAAELAALGSIVPLFQPDCANRSTASGASFSIDDEALLERKIAANRRLQEIKDLKRPKPEHAQEAERILQLLKFLDLYKEWSVTNKILTTYTEYEVEEDGCVHTSYIIHGTATGRLASRDPNLQNVPKQIRKVFRAPEGCTFVRKDYSNLELRVLAYVADDEVAIDMFQKGLNAHDENTKTMLGIDQSDPLWDTKRKGIKMGRFARNYGGSLETIYRKLMLAVPDFGLTFKQYQEAEARYEAAHPAWRDWSRESVSEVLKNKMLRTCFGRLRIFLGASYDIIREGPNFLIQSPAADIINKATIGIYQWLQKNPELHAHLCAQVHDELTVVCPEKNAKKVSAAMDKFMCQEHRIGRHLVSFPVETTIAKEWA